jgi:pimeloyl-ACP methyl ester carboxylesterase
MVLLVTAAFVIACSRDTPAPEPTQEPAPAAEAQAATPTPAPIPGATATTEPNLTSTPGPVTQVPPYFEETPCADFGVPVNASFACDFLTVLEDHSQPDGPTLRLAVVTARSTGENPRPDPIVYLSGGPGENAIESMQYLYGRHFAQLTQDRDLIIFDQRGTGLSQPSLDCPELITLRDEIIGQDISAEDALMRGMQALSECRDRLVREGVNLAAYTSAQSAADLNDLMQTLDYDQWNLYGISYGTRLALTTMRDFPEGIRSVVLDSPYPLEADLYDSIPVNADRAFDVLFQGCAADPTCNASYPDLEGTYIEAVERLNTNPVRITITNPVTDKSLEPLLDGNNLTGFLFQSLYATDVIPSLPKIIYEARNGNFDTLSLLMGSRLIVAELLSQGMQVSVQCAEEVPFTTQERIASATDPYPTLQPFLDNSPTLGKEITAVCADWGAEQAAPIEDEPVTSDIPALVLAGEYDPITPPEWGRQVAGNLGRSFSYEFPGGGHGVSVGASCPVGIMLAFLDDPLTEPDPACIAEMGSPGFVVPVTDVTLIPVESEAYGFSGVAPEGWQELAPGVYSQSALGDTVLFQQSAPFIGSEGFLDLFADQIGLSEQPAAAGRREANGLTWQLYRASTRGLSLDIALAEQEGTTYIVILQTTGGERDILYNEVFLPAIDALVPS